MPPLGARMDIMDSVDESCSFGSFESGGVTHAHQFPVQVCFLERCRITLSDLNSDWIVQRHNTGEITRPVMVVV